MTKTCVVYGRHGKRFVVDDVDVTEEQYLATLAHKPSLDEVLATEDGRQGLARSLHQDPSRRCGHESISCGVGKAMASEHDQWIRSQKLTGVTVLPSGNIQFSGSEREKDKYLAARGLVDTSSAGSGLKNDSVRMKDKPRGKKKRK